MRQGKIASGVFVVMAVLTAFVIGYFAGANSSRSEIYVETVAAEPPAALEIQQEVVSDSAPLDMPVNLNTATQQQLEMLPGIGPELAERILEYRKTVGKFLSIEQIMDVEGIGEKRFETLKDLITVEVAHENSGS